MRVKLIIGGLLASTVFLPALAQQAPTPAPAPSPPAQRMETTTTVTATKAMAGQWRTSKLVGVDVYNNANEKIGDINEILLEPSGKVTGFIIGVGGFLGMGEHDVLVKPDQIKFVNEPIRTTSAGETQAALQPARPLPLLRRAQTVRRVPPTRSGIPTTAS